jgi:hypothetical protein
LALALVLCICSSVIAVSAVDYAPSIEVKPTPEIVTPEGEAAEVGAVISDGTEIQKVLKSEINAISYEEAKAYIGDSTATDAEKKSVCETLVNAYNAFKQNGVEKSVEGIADVVKNDLKISNPKYFVSDLFELNIGEYASELEDDAEVTVSFSNAVVNAKAGKLIVAHMVEGKWKMVPTSDVVVSEDAIKVTFDELCPVVFLSVSEGEASTPGGDTKPPVSNEETKAPADEGDEDDSDSAIPDGTMIALMVIAAITLLAVAAIVGFYFYEKKSSASKGKPKK